MRIVSVIGNDFGGGGRAGFRLHSALRKFGHDVSLFMPVNLFADPDVTLFRPNTDLKSRALRWLRQRLQWKREALFDHAMARHGVFFHDGASRHAADALAQLPRADIVITHGFQDLCDHDAFFAAIPNRVPVVSVLHVPGVFTGGCCYPGSCAGFEAACGKCPQLDSDRERDLSRRIWRKREAAYLNAPTDRIHFIAPSRAIGELAKRSSLIARFPISVIPHGLDTAQYAPRDQKVAREIFDIPEKSLVILFLTQSSLDYKVKGLALLLEALRALPAMPNLFLLTLGKGRLPDDLPFPGRHLGSIHQDRLLSYVYSAADVLALPSLQENLPCVAMESLACGTPVVAFDTGGIPDMVRPGVTGLLAPTGNTGALKDALLTMLSDSSLRHSMAQNCRKIAVAEYSMERYAEAYTRVCQSLMERQGSNGGVQVNPL